MKGVEAIIVVVALGACSPHPDVLSVSADTVVSSSTHQTVIPGSGAGIWSSSGIPLRDKPVFSPDGRFILQWTEHGISVSGEAAGLLTPRVTGDAPLEILWSPRSNYVAITWSDDTAIPAWSVDAYYLGNGTPREIGIDSFFRSPDAAWTNINDTRPRSNFAALAWLEDESQLLIAAEQPLNGSWMNGLAVSGMKFSLPDEMIVESFDGAGLLASYRPYLGPRLLGELEQ